MFTLYARCKSVSVCVFGKGNQKQDMGFSNSFKPQCRFRVLAPAKKYRSEVSKNGIERFLIPVFDTQPNQEVKIKVKLNTNFINLFFSADKLHRNITFGLKIPL